jgi:hypothetical protein
MSNPHATGTLTAQSGDLAVAFVFQFVISNTTFTWANATEVTEFAKVGDYADGALAEATPTGNLTIAASGAENQDGGICALTLAGGGSSSPPPPPSPSGYPDASTTGVPPGTALAVWQGNMTITTPGAIIDSMDIRGCVTVNASNVVIRKSKVSCAGPSVVWSGSTNLLVENTTLDCQGTRGTALTPRNYTARRLQASGCENILWAEANVTLEDSYLHDPIPYNPATDPHTDSVQVPSGASNITIRHNRIYGGYINQQNFGNSAITSGGGVTNYLVENNVLAGGGFTIYCDGGGDSNYRVVNNRFSTVFVPTVGGFGPVFDCARNATQFSGNVYHESGQPLPGQ